MVKLSFAAVVSLTSLLASSFTVSQEDWDNAPHLAPHLPMWRRVKMPADFPGLDHAGPEAGLAKRVANPVTCQNKYKASQLGALQCVKLLHDFDEACEVNGPNVTLTCQREDASIYLYLGHKGKASLPCPKLANFANKILKKCTSKGRVAGKAAIPKYSYTADYRRRSKDLYAWVQHTVDLTV